MGEERNLEELPEARASSFTMVLGVTGIVLGLGVLFCGGVAAYVASTGPSGKDAETHPAPPAPDLENIRTTARKIADVDLPPGFEPLRNGSSPMMMVVTFGRPDVPATELTIGRIEQSSIPTDSSPETQANRMLQMLEMGGGTTTILRGTNSTTTRELTVLGQPASFKTMRGAVGPNEVRVTKVIGSFRTKAARIVLSYTIPEEEYDEDAVVRMIESIRPPAGDSAPTADISESSSPEETSGDPVDESGKNQPADDN
jgi:hypothetical protein